MRLSIFLFIITFTFPSLSMGAERIAFFIIPEKNELANTAQEFEYYFRKYIEKRMYVPAEISNRELAVFEDETNRREEETKNLLSEAKKLYEEFNLDQSFFVFQKIINNLEKGSAAFQKSKDYQVALMYLGNIYQLKGEKQLAKDTFIKLLVYNNKFSPDINYFSPDIIETFENVKYDVKNLKKGTLQISPKPEDVQVFVDGTFVGSGTFKIENLPSGEHLIGICKRGYLPYTRKVIIQPALMEIVSIDMVEFKEVSDRYKEINKLKNEDITPEIPPVLKQYQKDSSADILTIIFISGNKDNVALNGYTYYKDHLVAYKDTSMSLSREDTRKKVIRTEIEDLCKSILPDNVSSLNKITKISHKKFYTSWWFYSIIGVALVGAGTVGYMLFSNEDKENNNGALILSF